MENQLKLNFDPGLTQQHRDLRECFAACVYQRGLSRVAMAVDCAPSNLSQMLGGERRLDPEIIERYMREFDDKTPALFWAAKFCQSAEDQQAAALAQIPGLVQRLNDLMAATGKTNT